MGFEYLKIRRAAYHIRPDAAPLIVQYRALPFPERMRDNLLTLCNAARQEGQEPYRTVPTYRMDGVLQSLAPDLVVRGRGGDSSDNTEDFWLYAPTDQPHPLPGDTFPRLCTAWLQDLRPEPEHRSLLAQTRAELQANPPTWQDVSVDLLGCPVTAGGTAAPAARQFQLATDYLARRIMSLDPYDTGAGELTFRAVPRGPRQQGAELMSQPLTHDDDKRRTWWFSVLLNISLHTVPFSPLPRLHLHTGVRRWATRPQATTGRVWLPPGRATSIYLRPTVAWLPGAPASNRYAVARLIWDRGQQRYEWHDGGPAGILRRLTLSRAFPDPQDLLSDPVAWIDDRPGIRAAIVHSTHMGNHEVGAGLMSHQRSLITAWAEQALPEGLTRAADLHRSQVAVNRAANARPKPTGAAAIAAEEARTVHARRVALAHAQRADSVDTSGVGVTASGEDGSPVVLEARLLWQTDEMRDKAITALITTLGLTGDGGAADLAPDVYDGAQPGSPVILAWHTQELVVRLRCLKLTGGIAESLAVGPAARPKRLALSTAIERRRSAVADFLTDDGADPNRPSLALVEIDRRADFPTSADDPKFAMRLGCADAGVITQFVAVPKIAKRYNSRKNATHRASSAWQDGLRQLGVRVLPQHTLGGNLPADLQYAAVWMVKCRNDSRTGLPRHLPVAVLVEPDPQHPGEARIRGWDPEADSGAGDWIPYPRFLLRLTKLAEIPGSPQNIDSTDTSSHANDQQTDGDEDTAPRWITYRLWRQNMDEQRKSTVRFLQKLLHSRTLRSCATVLLTHSQNSRSHWPWLQDGQTVVDLIRTGHAPAASLNPQLRLVRIRSTKGRETPQWWGQDSPTGVSGLPAGLWTEHAEIDDERERTATAERIFYSTTEKASTFKKAAVEADKLAPRPLRAGPRKGEPTIDTAIPAWNPGLVEIAILGCHPNDGDDPQALALAVHQLRQAPDYLDALALPLPLHLAGLAQHYVLPTIGEDAKDDGAQADASTAPTDDSDAIFDTEIATTEDELADPDPDAAEAIGLAQFQELDDQIPVPT